MANYTVNAYNNGGTGGSVNMRSGPSTNDGIVVRVPHGATVTGTKSGTWSYMTYNTYTGYMMSVYLDEQSGGILELVRSLAAVRCIAESSLSQVMKLGVSSRRVPLSRSTVAPLPGGMKPAGTAAMLAM